MRVAVLTTVLPSTRRTGGEVAIASIVDAIEDAGHDVTVVGYARHGATAAPAEQAVAARTIELDAAPRSERAAWAAQAVLHRLPLSAAKYRSAAYRDAARAATASADAIVIGHTQSAWWIPERGLDVPFALVCQNDEAAVYRDAAADASGARAAVLRREARLVGALERRLVARATEVWTLTTEETDHFRTLGGNVRQLDLPGSTEPPPRPRRAERGVALLGTWSWRPNAAGLQWFVDQVVPRLQVADVHVAGGGAAWVGDRPGVTYHGFVADARAFLDSARVVAIPSTVGRGVQIKTLDALALGSWVVATSTALRGLDVGPPVVQVADDPAAFARAIDALVVDPATEARSEQAIAWSAPRRERLSASVAAGLSALSR